MNLRLKVSKIKSKATIAVSGSKSETNRLLLMQVLYPNLILENSSNSDDSEVMLKALSGSETLKDIHHAGTAMRFLTAYFAVQDANEVVLTGSNRMQERPIKILVEALRQLGAEIHYEQNEGFPPLRIKGKKLVENKVSLPADISSQYISALLLIAPKLQNGLELTLEGKITSVPYIQMTLAVLKELGISAEFEGQIFKVKPKFEIPASKFIIESDWSSASYFYSIVALSEVGTQIQLSSYKKNSLQGDSVLMEIYRDLGVETTFEENTLLLEKVACILQPISRDLNNSPDIAQTIAVTCFGLGVGCHLTGLHTLKIKETDRLLALKNELGKLGARVSVTEDSLTLEPAQNIRSGIEIATYQDHRMAMAFAPLALKTDLVIQEAEVVSKSYPDFWNDLKNIGFQISER
ncbi:3-phosphoshikimate 1-carboxyvinyltransferase [Flavobacterium sp. SM15]|uniref:3-phosphoshikimate 1-carboxyvinyltransferase n=1 Tax=Flavobacterium sp. SM15 TaxID=2908005 RepID=UPI001EDAF24C|nr:3-phosphoshikimate 1-carboxyvinyltransferase [Flavobacterium sp. SM15]MCG2609909.1 3-phosphoshikimate 1-carboxyvinyltransferase [Flavobacterium sp. SM15]